jgi:hypothetical protein
MLGKRAFAINAVILVCLGLGLTNAVAETGSGGMNGGGDGRAWRVGAWNGAVSGGGWRGPAWYERGWSWDSNWGWGWPAPAAAWYYGPYYGACLQPQWTGNRWVWVNVC